MGMGAVEVRIFKRKLERALGGWLAEVQIEGGAETGKAPWGHADTRVAARCPDPVAPLQDVKQSRSHGAAQVMRVLGPVRAEPEWAAVALVDHPLIHAELDQPRPTPFREFGAASSMHDMTLCEERVSQVAAQPSGQMVVT